MRYTTAYPYRLDGVSLNCVCCFDTFNDPAEYRKHFKEEHNTFSMKTVFNRRNSHGLLRVDCTELYCKLCPTKFDTLHDIAEHLHEVHKFEVDLSAGFALLPNKYQGLKLLCAICNVCIAGLRQLSYHMSTHYRTFICETCGKAYMTKPGLKTHLKNSHKEKVFRCVKCKKTFDNAQERKEHRLNAKECWQYRCKICKERFMRWILMQAHLVDAHKQPERPYRCKECQETFPNQIAHYNHFKLMHSNDHSVCSFCGLKFPTKSGLENHVVSHTKEKKFPCSMCNKVYPRKKALRRHMLSVHVVQP